MLGTFLQKLKKKEVKSPAFEEQQSSAAEKSGNPAPKDSINGSQLNVDIFQGSNAIVIYAQIAGAGSQDFSVMVQGDGDIITIRGQRIKPTGQFFEDTEKDGAEKILEECSWGKFYRQIILPTEVDSANTEAKMKNGVLMLSLPLKGAHDSEGTRIEVREV